MAAAWRSTLPANFSPGGDAARRIALRVVGKSGSAGAGNPQSGLLFYIFQQLLHIVFIDVEKLAVQQGRVIQVFPAEGKVLVDGDDLVDLGFADLGEVLAQAR